MKHCIVCRFQSELRHLRYGLCDVVDVVRKPCQSLPSGLDVRQLVLSVDHSLLKLLNSYECPDTRSDPTYAKRFGNVVVCACIQAFNLVTTPFLVLGTMIGKFAYASSAPSAFKTPRLSIASIANFTRTGSGLFSAISERHVSKLGALDTLKSRFWCSSDR